LSRLQLVILGVMNLSLYKPYFPTLSNEQIWVHALKLHII
jgi:hypothetical protein